MNTLEKRILFIGLLALVGVGISVASLIVVTEKPAIVIENVQRVEGLTIQDLHQFKEGDLIVVKGTVNRILDDYVSKRGRSFQQFYIEDSTGELKIFQAFNATTPRVAIEEGETIMLRGTLEFYNDELELVNVRRVK